MAAIKRGRQTRQRPIYSWELELMCVLPFLSGLFRFSFHPARARLAVAGFLLFLPAFEKKNESVAERPAENWFLGHGSKSGHRTKCQQFFLARQEGSSTSIASFPLRRRFSGRSGLKRTDNARYVRLRRITFCRDFHGLTIRTGALNCRNSDEHGAFSPNGSERDVERGDVLVSLGKKSSDRMAKHCCHLKFRIRTHEVFESRR